MITAERLTPPLWTRWLAVVLWMGLIFIMSAQSNSGEQSGALAKLVFQVLGGEPSPDQLMSVHHLMRKAAHFSEYAILVGLMAWAQPGFTWKRAALSWGFATLYAASDEWHQSFVPNRGPAPLDVLIDSTGALAGVVAWRFWSLRR
jgi:VanZ family protein